jgi:hypothetical protein
MTTAGSGIVFFAQVAPVLRVAPPTETGFKMSGNPKPEAALHDIGETVRHIAGGAGDEEQLHVVRW